MSNLRHLNSPAMREYMAESGYRCGETQAFIDGADTITIGHVKAPVKPVVTRRYEIRFGAPQETKERS
jgi:hypothetical protein